MAAVEVPKTLEYMGGQLNAAPILEDFQDSPDDEEDTRSTQEYMNDLEEEYQARALLAKSKSSSASAPSSSLGKNKGLIAKTYDWDEEEVSSDDNEVTEVKALMALGDEEIVYVGKKVPEMLWSKDLVFVKSSTDNSEVSITDSNKSKLSEAKDSTLSNHDTCKVPSNKSQINTTDHSVIVSDSSATDYDSADESSVYSTPFPPLEKLTGAEPISRPKTIKLILNSEFTFKAETLKDIIINEPPQLLLEATKVLQLLKLIQLLLVPPNALQNKYKTQFKMNYELCRQNNHLSENCYEVLFCKKCKKIDHKTCDHAEFISSMKSDDYVYYPTCKLCGSYDHDTRGHNRIISLRRGIKPRNPQHVTKNCETCGSNVHTTIDHNNIKWFRKREALQSKKAKTLKISKTESSSALKLNTPTKRLINLKEAFQSTKNVKDLLKKYDINGSSVIAPMQFVAMFLAEAEDLVVAGCCANILWIRSQLTDYDIYEKEDMEFHFIPTKYQLADILIKLLDKLSFKRLINELGMLKIDSKPEASVLTEEN
ncbi:hypothetical protein Tco_0446808 [Tanacetum coccineum]